MIFELACGTKFIMVIELSEVSLLGQIFVLRTPNFLGATISRKFLDTSKENTRMESTRPWIFFVNKRPYRTNCTFGFHCFNKKKVKNNSIWFLNWRVEENLVANNKYNRVYCVYVSDLSVWLLPLGILMFRKPAYSKLRFSANICFKNIKLKYKFWPHNLIVSAGMVWKSTSAIGL